MELEVIEGNRILEKIHNSFYSMDGIIDTKIQRELRIAYDKEKKENVEKLKALGFSKSSSFEIFEPTVIKENEELNDLLNEYSVAYPGYKFITDEKIVELCKKYNLYTALPNRYIGHIPEKNQRDILNFKSKHPHIKKRFAPEVNSKYIEMFISNVNMYYDYYVSRQMRNPGTGYIRSYYGVNKENLRRTFDIIISSKRTPTTTNEIYPEFDIDITRAVAAFRKIDKDYEGQHLALESELFIAATADLLDSRNCIANSNNEYIYFEGTFRAELPIVSDPIVFKKVKRGAIIVTAWGPEAEDELVVNEKMN